MGQLNNTIKIFSTVLYLTGLILLSSCASTVVPLDPIIGDTGQPLSVTAQKADVKKYALELEIFPESKSIEGVGHTEFLIVENTYKVELKLDSRFSITQVEVDNQEAKYTREGGVIIIDLATERSSGEMVNASIYYSGKPHVALRAPWAGGFVWSETEEGLPWIATAVQGEGCDLIWPCKDHFTDKADEMHIALTVPKSVSAVTNGVLQNIKEIGKDKHQFNWLLSVPASDYNIALNIGPFVRIQKTYKGINGTQIPIEFWALKKNQEKAEKLINEDLMDQIKFYEDRLGPYPWGDQKLGFVETPHLGMEHQTVNAYGNKYKRDENGFDWLLHHELAHEWFGNLITHEKINDAWLHEGFGLYMQPDYSWYKFGEAAYKYRMYRSYLGLMNCEPVVQDGVITSDQAFQSDIYGKGGWTLHSLRWLMGEDTFWQATRELLYGTVDTYILTYPIAPRYRNTDDFLQIVNRITGQDYTWLFDVYLKQAELPVLTEERTDSQLTLKWKVPQNLPFPMPIPVSINGESEVYQIGTEGVSFNVGQNDKVIIDPEMKVFRYLNIIGSCEENKEKRDRKKAN